MILEFSVCWLDFRVIAVSRHFCDIEKSAYQERYSSSILRGSANQIAALNEATILANQMRREVWVGRPSRTV